MEITYLVVITIVTYIFGAITKAFINVIPNRFIPLQNVIIGIVSAVICYFSKLEPNLLNAFVLCLIASMGAGGIDGLKNIKTDNSKE